jgi:hypothetical protein
MLLWEKVRNNKTIPASVLTHVSTCTHTRVHPTIDEVRLVYTMLF